MPMLVRRRKVLRTLLLYISGTMVFLLSGKVFSLRKAARALGRNAGTGELQDVAFAVAGMT